MATNTTQGFSWADAELYKRILKVDYLGRQYIKSLRKALRHGDAVSRQFEAIMTEFDELMLGLDADWRNKLAQLNFRRSSEVTAALVGTSPATVDRVRRVIRDADPYTRTMLERGQMTIQAAVRQSKRDREDRKIIEAVPRPNEPDLPIEKKLSETLLAVCGAREVSAFWIYRILDKVELKGVMKAVGAFEEVGLLSARDAKTIRKASEQLSTKRGW